MRYGALKDAVAAALESSDARRVGYRARVLCPNCVSSKTNRPDHSMSVSLEEGWFYCQRCAVKGKLWESVTGTIRAMTPPEPQRFTQSYGVSLSVIGDGSVFGEKLRAFVSWRQCEYIVHAPDVECDSCNSFRSSTYPFDVRLIVKMRRVDSLNEVTGAQHIDCYEQATGRWITEKRTVAGSDRAGSFYNAAAVVRPSRRPLLVVEGFFDAVAHLPDAAAVMGLPSNTHLDLLAFAPRPVVFALDGDAWERGWAYAQYLQHMGQTAASIRLPPKRDPDDFKRSDLMRMAIDALLNE